MTHHFEFYRSDPRAGFRTSLAAAFSGAHAFSDVAAQRFRWSGEALWNIRNYDPPLFVIAVRGAAATTVTGETLEPSTGIPPLFRQYLGGSDNLRGFGRLELPGPLGGLSSAFASLELRFAAGLALGIQPIVFTDLGAFGVRPMEIESTLYWSPGFGVRWTSPVGVLRASLAHGYVTEGGVDPALTHLQFDLSLGEEF